MAQRSTSTEPERCPYCNQDPNRWRSQTGVAPPGTQGSAAAVVEGACGQLVYGLNQNERLPPASLTKIVTAMVAVEQARPSERVPITVNGWDLYLADGSSTMGLEAGMNLSVEELLYGLLLPSGNDAALALAEYLGGGSRFVGLMNELVRRLGLSNTRFTNPDGRQDQNHYSSPLDMAILGREFMKNPALSKIAATPFYRPNWNGPQLWNNNYLLQSYKGALGVKIGYTEEANFTIVAAAKRDGRELYAVVLGSPDIYTDAAGLLDWAFANTRSSCTSDG